MKSYILFFQIILLYVFYGCSDNGNSEPEPQQTPFQELFDQGIDKYVGQFEPATSSVSSPGVTQYIFTGEDGPVCFTGNEFSMFTRDGSSNNLLIFLQGGGFCAPDVCAAVDVGIPFFPVGILNPQDAQNPVADYDVGYLPYCDGTAFMGDNDVDSDGDGTSDRFFRGLQNLSASLDVIVRQYPNPEKIVIAGNSAGGFAVHAALPLVRLLYPEVPIYVINDSGVGILDPGGMNTLLTYWNADVFFPPSCDDCIGDDGNLTGLHAYQLEEDTNVKMAYISSKQDETIAMTLSGGGASLETQLLEAASELNTQFPDRFNSMIDNGDQHTYIMRTFDAPVGGVPVRDWVSAMINNTSEWISIVE